jgi:transcriptional regulator with XRE-family HTH domain
MADKFLLELGHRIRKLRQQHGWTQVEMAEKTGLDRSFLADVERGKRNISIRNLYFVARGFKKTLSQLLSGVQ